MNRPPVLDFQQLETFQKVAETGSFTQAAAALGYSQSTVTYHIKSLEEKLGLVLFDRHRFSKTTVLTGAGKRVLEYTHRVADLSRALLSQTS